MKILLIAINAKYIHSNPAVYSLQAYTAPFCTDIRVEILERTINEPEENILEAIIEEKADVIAFSCYIWNWRMIKDLLREIPKLLPDLPIWLGGPEVSYEPALILQEYQNVTGIMRGEGEESFLELVKAYQSCGKTNDIVQKNGSWPQRVTGNQDRIVSALRNVAGICTRDYDNGVRESLDVNRLPFLYSNPEQFRDKIIYYESQRGCPFSCAYCLSCVDKRVRLKDISIIKKELKHLKDCGIRQVKFVDRTFNCNHEHCMEIWKYLMENDSGITNYHFEIAADCLTEDELQLLQKARPGLFRLEVGIQTVNSDTLRAIHRYSDWRKLKNTVERLLAGKNQILHLDLICGLPYENLDSFRNSFDQVYRLHPRELQLGFLKVLKGTPIEEKVKEYGMEYQSEPPYEILKTAWIGYEELRSVKKVEEMLETYYNSAQFCHTLARLESYYQSPYALYEALASFYRKKGYDVRTPSRSTRYMVLYEFITEVVLQVKFVGGVADADCDTVWVNEAELYRELLLYDMYLRENLKTRPAFAANQDAYRKTVEAFYQLEATNRTILPAYADYTARQMERMTHMEYFRYPVWNQGAMLTKPESCERRNMIDRRQTSEEEGGYVLFDYSESNPVTLEVRTVNLKLIGLKGDYNVDSKEKSE